MRTPVKDIVAVLKQQYDQGVASADIAKSLVQYLFEEHRIKDLDKILRALVTKLEADGQKELTVTSVHPLSNELKNEIITLFKDSPQQNVIINEQLDKSLLGGLVIESNDQRLDVSIRRRLQRLKGVNV